MNQNLVHQHSINIQNQLNQSKFEVLSFGDWNLLHNAYMKAYLLSKDKMHIKMIYNLYQLFLIYHISHNSTSIVVRMSEDRRYSNPPKINHLRRT